MLEILVFMAPAIVMCLILAGICGYVGIHVIMREVIFIDIALAQIAALGASFALFLGLELDSPWTYVVSLGVTLLASLLLSSTHRLRKFAPQESYIGILYATGAAAVLLVGDRLAHGNEHVHDLMVGHLLWVNWKEVATYSIIFAVLGLVFLACHSRIYRVSENYKDHAAKTRHQVLWDFMFYALLGVLVTFAVRVAGVLLVFGFLIVPATIGMLLAKNFWPRLAIGWAVGVTVSLAGSYVSFEMDLPTGASVVVTLGLFLLLVAAVKGLMLKFGVKKNELKEAAESA